jgi:hypothetical protein
MTGKQHGYQRNQCSDVKNDIEFSLAVLWIHRAYSPVVASSIGQQLENAKELAAKTSKVKTKLSFLRRSSSFTVDLREYIYCWVKGVNHCQPCLPASDKNDRIDALGGHSGLSLQCFNSKQPNALLG